MCRLVGGGCFFEDFVLVFDNVEKKKNLISIYIFNLRLTYNGYIITF